MPHKDDLGKREEMDMIQDQFRKWYSEKYDKKKEKGKDGNMPMMDSYVHVKDAYDDYIVIEKEGEMYKVNYKYGHEGYKFEPMEKWKMGYMKFVESDNPGKKKKEDDGNKTLKDVLDEGEEY